MKTLKEQVDDFVGLVVANTILDPKIFNLCIPSNKVGKVDVLRECFVEEGKHSLGYLRSNRVDYQYCRLIFTCISGNRRFTDVATLQLLRDSNNRLYREFMRELFSITSANNNNKNYFFVRPLEYIYEIHINLERGSL